MSTEHPFPLDQAPSYPHDSLSSHLPLKEERNKQTIIGGVVLFLWIFLFLIAYICWPRVPRIHIINKKADRVGDPADWGPKQQPYFKAVWQLNITIDNHVSFVPTLVQAMHFVIKDRDTFQPFAWSTVGPFRLMSQQSTSMTISFKVDYEPSNITDVTFENLYDACGPQIPAESPPLNITMQTTVHVSGLFWPFVVNLAASDIGGLYCPLN
ncbi:hypothetical protein BD560DRAFT_45463 [Blakeslea trispora]|nr:hypothetical protein BD560DRAFT_45463 [Blakeslea trispora]